MGPLAYIIGSPRLHHWHHDKHLNKGCNFANLSPLMDLMFGTYYDPGKEPEEYGIQERSQSLLSCPNYSTLYSKRSLADPRNQGA